MKTHKFTSVDFSFRVSEGFTSRTEDDPKGQWGYGESILHYLREKDEAECTNFFFYYWQKEKSEPQEERYLKLVKEICKEKLFTARHSLKLIEKSPITFKRTPGFLLKFRYSHSKPRASGPASFFVFYHKRKQKVFILGILVEQRGDALQERKSLAFMEDEFIASFRFLG